MQRRWLRAWPWRLALGAALGLGTLPQARAHADLLEQIAGVTVQLEASPANAALLLQRAELRRRHADFKFAFADLAAAEKLRPGWPDLALARARTLLDAGRTAEALQAARGFLQNDPAHLEARVIEARSLVRLGKRAEGIADFSAVIARLPAPPPDLLLERAQAQAALGRFGDAVSGLDEGLAKLGEIPSLQLPAIEFERRRANFDGALARVDRLLARYPVKEPWLALRGEVLEQAGRLAAARDTFRQVLAGLEAYPPFRRGLELTQQLEARARDGLARTEARLASAKISAP